MIGRYTKGARKRHDPDLNREILSETTYLCFQKNESFQGCALPDCAIVATTVWNQTMVYKVFRK